MLCFHMLSWWLAGKVSARAPFVKVIIFLLQCHARMYVLLLRKLFQIAALCKICLFRICVFVL